MATQRGTPPARFPTTQGRTEGARSRWARSHRRPQHLRRGGNGRHRVRTAHRTASRRGGIDPEEGIAIIATGPLTSDALASSVARLTGSERLFFYDSISPIVDAETVDTSVAFWASRYGKSTDGTDDYLNCPLDRDQYERFVDELLAAQSVPAHIAEDSVCYFEACLPIEEIARRGRDTLRFGPMKPMGLTDPRTGKRPYAVVQLRQENLRAQSFNLVGFQNHMRFGEQQRILRLIPGLERAEFLRYGQIHRNTYINAPALLTASLQLRSRPEVFLLARSQAWKATSNRSLLDSWQACTPRRWRRANRHVHYRAKPR